MIRKLLARGKAAWAVVPDGKTELLIQRRPKKLYAGANGQPIARRAAPNPSCPRDYVAEFVEYLKSAEKFIPHMYLDTTEKRFGPEDSTGNVTVGIGHYLADIGMVMETRNRFYLPQAAIDAGRTLDEVLAEDFNRLFGQNSRGRVADDYAALTTARMSESEALGMLREDVDSWFDFDTDSPYMLMVADVKSERQKTMSPDEEALFGIEKLNIARSEIPAVTHIDYSARIQTVHADTNPRYHALISAFKSRTGCPVVVNTSFNVRGEPIVCTPEDAFLCFMGTEIELLAIGNCLLRKDEQDPAMKLDYKNRFLLD